ncbi:hypothetical protein NL676_027927 [Syzygium grande]|nr:hypothetical protein NL676_027927 [Syzygium grande]
MVTRAYFCSGGGMATGRAGAAMPRPPPFFASPRSMRRPMCPNPRVVAGRYCHPGFRWALASARPKLDYTGARERAQPPNLPVPAKSPTGRRTGARASPAPRFLTVDARLRDRERASPHTMTGDLFVGNTVKEKRCG